MGVIACKVNVGVIACKVNVGVIVCNVNVGVIAIRRLKCGVEISVGIFHCVSCIARSI